ncbi:DUF58 domain-containing protein [Paenarthrobacter sp. NPDC090522]|uniref:DUF58 domain-containing protein n=1 Tax=Paenarthrobacter sp. NPDC090522 TaxID=3364383 RepID=UPI0037FA74D2
MPSLLQRVKAKMFIFAHRKTTALLDGEYGSVFKGRSLDFDDLRSYVPGDEVRDIDWKATARHGSPLVKRYTAVRRHSVLLLVDTGRTMAAEAASGEAKVDLAIQAAGVVGYLACRHGDDVGLLHGSVEATRYLPPRSGEHHLERLLREVQEAVRPEGPASALAGQLDYALRYLKGRLLVVGVADEFLPDARTEELLRRLRVRHEVLWITIKDADLAGEERGRSSRDVGQGFAIPKALVDSSEVRQAYTEAMARRDAQRRDVFRRLGIAEEHVGSSGEMVSSVFALLERHKSGKAKRAG